jgi:hypothetical protein
MPLQASFRNLSMFPPARAAACATLRPVRSKISRAQREHEGDEFVHTDLFVVNFFNNIAVHLEEEARSNAIVNL